MKKILLPVLLLLCLSSYAQPFTPKQYRDDFNYFWENVGTFYCFFEKRNINWDALKPVYDKQIDTVTTRYGFIATLERAMYELYDHHCSLRANNKDSRRLVPTGADIWAAYINNKPVVVEVRKGFGAEKAGITAGMEIIAVNGEPVDEAIMPFLGHTVNDESKSFALRLLLAGNHHTPRRITLKNGSQNSDFYPDREGALLEDVSYPEMVESKTFGRTGYIKINNYLYDNAIIARFDSVLDAQLIQQAIIIDLRETPSGGNSTVARAILGRFIKKEQFYQKHEFFNEEKQTGIKRSWVEIVSPRGKTFLNPVVVLADHWTGSIAEGISIAFDGMKRATVTGTELARLNGAVDSFEMPNTKIGFNIATERLYHLDGTPRENFSPAVLVNVEGQRPDNDVILNTAITYLKNKVK